MLTLSEAVQIYVQQRRAGAGALDPSHKDLVTLGERSGDLALQRIAPHHIAAWLHQISSSPVSWEAKYHALHRFFDFWVKRGEIQRAPMPSKRKDRSRAFVPYIYTRVEIRTLLRTVRASQQALWCRIDGETLRTLLILLYGTGVLVGEAQRLLLDDVDLRRGTIVVRGPAGNRPRTLPIGDDIVRALTRYQRMRQRKKTSSEHFFVNKKGEALNPNTLYGTFKRIRLLSGIRRNDGAYYQPRIHDLRPTFAVHRITVWLRHGADLNRMLPALAAYMGQIGLGSTTRYLALTPERFRAQLKLLSPGRRKRHWRDDAELMRFLEQLDRVTDRPLRVGAAETRVHD